MTATSPVSAPSDPVADSRQRKILAVPFDGLVIHRHQSCRVLNPQDIAIAKNTNVELPDKASGSLRLNLQDVAFECWVLADDFEDNTIRIYS